MKAESGGQDEMAGGVAAEGGGGGGEGSTSSEATINAAERYMKEVMETFGDQEEKLVMFREIMNDFRTERTDIAGVVGRVKELFKGHNNLIEGFNFFLPKGYEITVDKHQPPPDTLEFIRLVKERDESVYRRFMDVIFRYQREHMDLIKLCREVGALFSEDYPDLFVKFIRFLPPT
ncbi:paired amphipathic helix protein Sin3-like 2 [Gossypium raimondii]|nr:paired amphipathic helix protein Sin3-like 2 [Gossypium raimondii]